MAYSFGWGIPADSILRRGTLIAGVTKRDPIASAAHSPEDDLQKSIAERNGGIEQSQKSEPTTRKPDENT